MLKIAAIFDVDRTLIRLPSERLFFLYLLQRRVLTVPRAVIFFTQLLHYHRQRHSNKFYLQGLEAVKVRRLAQDCYRCLIRPRLSAVGLARLQEHQRQGHQTIILTGSLEYLMQPMHEDLKTHWLIATRLEVKDGLCTGRIQGQHPRGIHKLHLLQELAQKAGFDLAQSYAYADHISDLPLLQHVGYPIAINPSSALRTLACQQAWPIQRF